MMKKRLITILVITFIPATVHTIAGFHNLQIIINYSF